MAAYLTLLCSLIATVASLNTREYKACWNVTLTDESLFCYGDINGPIDEDTFYNAKSYDEVARQNYTKLKDKWLALREAGEDSTMHPTNDCLAVARGIYCAAAFRRCRDWQAEK